LSAEHFARDYNRANQKNVLLVEMPFGFEVLTILLSHHVFTAKKEFKRLTSTHTHTQKKQLGFFALKSEDLKKIKNRGKSFP